MRSRWLAAGVGAALIGVSFAVFLLSSRGFDATRGDLFYLADAFLHGRTWLPFALGPYDIVFGGIDGQTGLTRLYVPFAPFPAIALMPIVAVIGPIRADNWQPIINSALAAADVWLAYWLVRRIGVGSIRDALFLAVLMGFSTQIWWVTTRGGVWHTGHLLAVLLTLAALIEVFGKRRAILLGLLGGAAFLTRAPLAFAIPFYLAVIRQRHVGQREGTPPSGWRSWRDLRTWPVEGWLMAAIAVSPFVAFFLLYNWQRFGTPLESGYSLATLPPWLDQIRAQGLFSVSHLGMNVDYLFWHLPIQIPTFPFFMPDGLGMSIFITSPALLRAVRAPWRDPVVGRLAIGLGITAVLTLLPNLLYYGGGWLQYGYRYALDSIPFVFALAAMASVRHGFDWKWKLLTIFGVIVGLGSVYWAYPR